MQVLKTSVVLPWFCLRAQVPIVPFQSHDEMFISMRAHFEAIDRARVSRPPSVIRDRGRSAAQVEDEARADQGHAAQCQFTATRRAHGSNVELMKEHS
jgi:hypothetical protein